MQHCQCRELKKWALLLVAIYGIFIFFSLDNIPVMFLEESYGWIFVDPSCQIKPKRKVNIRYGIAHGGINKALCLYIYPQQCYYKQALQIGPFQMVQFFFVIQIQLLLGLGRWLEMLACYCCPWNSFYILVVQSGFYWLSNFKTRH